MNGLYPWLKMQVSLLEPKSLASMMKLALKIKHREMVRKEAGLVSVYTYHNSIFVTLGPYYTV